MKIVLRTAAGATSGVKSTEIKYYKRWREVVFWLGLGITIMQNIFIHYLEERKYIYIDRNEQRTYTRGGQL
jgi:hypothetical protein